MDKEKMNFAADGTRGEETPDVRAAESVFNRVLDTAGVPRPEEPLEAVVRRVKKRRRVGGMLTVMGLVLIVLIITMGGLLFLREYFTHVTVSPSMTLTENVEPPHSESVRYRDGALEMCLVPGESPLDYASASAVRASDGAAVAVECDEESSTVYIPCSRDTDDYYLTISDAEGIPYTFVLHIVSGG